jgi:hypothetical protein
MRGVVHESDVYLEGKKFISKEMNLVGKFELYILNELFNSTKANNFNEFADFFEKKCTSTNEYGLALYSEF